MSPFGLILIGIGLVMIVIGFKGSQHNVMNAFKGVHTGGTSGSSGGGSQGGKGKPPPLLVQPPKFM